MLKTKILLRLRLNLQFLQSFFLNKLNKQKLNHLFIIILFIFFNLQIYLINSL